MFKNLLALLLVVILPTATLPLTGCSSFPTATQITQTAATIGSDTTSYVQTLANMVYTVTNLAGVAAPTIEALANTWGLLPANSSQLATFNKVVNAITNANSSAATVSTLLTTLSATGKIPSTTTTSGKYSYKGVLVQDSIRWKAGVL